MTEQENNSFCVKYHKAEMCWNQMLPTMRHWNCIFSTFSKSLVVQRAACKVSIYYVIFSWWRQDWMCCSLILTCCWNCTMSIRFWAPGERLVPISFTRLWTCCMSMPGPRAGQGSTCCSPTMTRDTKTLFLPARDNNYKNRQMKHIIKIKCMQ